MSIQCFLVKETSWCILYARRYADNCPNHFCHNAQVKIGYFPIEKKMYGTTECNSLPEKYEVSKDSTVWPIKCEHCDYIFQDIDAKQNFYEVMYAKVDSENEDVSKILVSEDEQPLLSTENGFVTKVYVWWSRRDLLEGAMFRASWMNGFWDNETEDHLMVVVPGKTEWDIDSRANNCSMPEERTHRCWVRTGIPPNVTVGKNGHTCQAGAGSIATPGYHGMLENGMLRSV